MKGERFQTGERKKMKKRIKMSKKGWVESLEEV